MPISTTLPGQTINGTDDNDTLLGGPNDDSIDGGSGADQIVGNDGNDTLSGGAGADLIDGGAGDDWIRQDVTADADTIRGGAGIDTLDFSGLTPGVRVSIDMSTFTVWKYGADYRSPSTLIAIDEVSGIENFIGSGLGDQFFGARMAENFIGGNGADHLEGREGNDTLLGGGGNDTLCGGEGSDLVSAGDGDDLVVFYYYDARSVTLTINGSDTIDGGAGSDTLDYRQNFFARYDTIVADLAAGTVNKFVAGTYIGTDTVSNFEAIFANNNDDVITGSARDEVLDGGAGNDTLDGGGGNDMIIGGRGSDLIIQRQMRGNDTIDGGTAYDANFDTVDYSNAGPGAAIMLDLPLAAVHKFQDGMQVGTDTLIDVDLIIGTRYDDTINGSADNDILMDSGAGNDLISGNGGDDYLGQKIAAGNDTIDGGEGNDTVDYSVGTPGGSIAFDITTHTVQKFLNGLLVGTDTLRNVETVIATDGNDTLTGSMQAETLEGRGGDDRIMQGDFAAGDAIDGGTGQDTVDYGAAPAGASVVVDLANGTVSKLLDGDLASTDTLQHIEGVTATAGADTIGGSSNADVLDGAGGNDQLDGGAGNDTLIGGAGDNVLAGGDGDDRFLETAWIGSNAIDGGTGNDTADYHGGMAGASVALDLSTGIVHKFVNGIQVGKDTLRNVESVIVTANADTINGSAAADLFGGEDGDDSLHGGAGNDTIDGGAGHDLVTGDAGDDVLRGGSGNDSLYGNDGQDSLDGGSGNDSLNGNDGQDNLDGGSGDDSLAGGAGNDLLLGGAGNDVLDGGSGNDIVAGGDGDDRMVSGFDFGNDSFDGGNGFDTADYSRAAEGGSIRAFLATGEVNKFLNGALLGVDHLSNVEGIVGTNGYDLIYGGTGNELIDGGSGGDILNGGAGNDTLYGGAGNDFLDGSSGNDLIDGGAGDDMIFQKVFAGNNVTIDGGAGVDTVDYGEVQISPDASDGSPIPVVGPYIHVDFASGMVSKFANGEKVGTDQLRDVEHLIGSRYTDIITAGAFSIFIEGGGGRDIVTGSQFADTLSGGAGYDELHGMDGNDVLIGGSDKDDLFGGAGDDRFVQDVLSGNDTIRGDSGIDTVDYYRDDIAGNINADLGTGKILKIQSGKVVGTDFVSGIEAIHGTTYNDRIIGSAVSEWLSGDTGDDIIGGGAGNDTIVGGAGNDGIDAGTGDDWIIQDHARGDDTMDLGAGFDTLDYSQLEPGTRIRFDGGSGQADKYLGNVRVGTDYLRGFERVIGTDGNDKLIGNGHADAFDGGAGDDIIDSGGGNDTLDGGAGNDTIKAGDGADIVKGGAGDDRFIQEAYAAADRFDGGDGSDTIDCSSLTYTSPTLPTIDVDLAQGTLARLTSWYGTVVIDSLSSIENIIGSARSDWISGNEADNNLSGGGGNDTLEGMNGNDILTGGDGNDLINGGSGNDVISGGAGNDLLFDSDGSDTYRFDAGFGQDLLVNSHDPASANMDTDRVVFTNISADKLLFQRVHGDLKIAVAGQTDVLTLLNWYGGSGSDPAATNHPVETFSAGAVQVSASAVLDMVSLIGAAPVSMATIATTVLV